MDASLAISAMAAVVSVAALVSSTFLTARQLKLSRQVAHIPTFFQLMEEFRDPQFHDKYQYVVSKLKEEHDAELGIFDLPEPARSAVIDIIYFFQNSASFTAFGLLDEPKMIAFLHVRLIKVWDAVEPYVTVERERNPTVGKHWLSRLQVYAERARDLSQDDALNAFARVGRGWNQSR